MESIIKEIWHGNRVQTIRNSRIVQTYGSQPVRWIYCNLNVTISVEYHTNSIFRHSPNLEAKKQLKDRFKNEPILFSSEKKPICERKRTDEAQLPLQAHGAIVASSWASCERFFTHAKRINFLRKV